MGGFTNIRPINSGQFINIRPIADENSAAPDAPVYLPPSLQPLKEQVSRYPESFKQSEEYKQAARVVEPTDQASLRKRLWRGLTEGVVSPETVTRAVSGKTAEQEQAAVAERESAGKAPGLPGMALSAGRVLSSYTSPINLAAMAAGPLGEAVPPIGTAAKVIGLGAGPYMAVQGARAMFGGEPEETRQQRLERIFLGGSQMAMGAAAAAPAAKMGAAAAKTAAKTGYEFLTRVPPKETLIRALSSGRGAKFSDYVDRLQTTGHLGVFQRQYQPKTVLNAYNGLRDYMGKWETSTIGAAVQRHPNATISGGAVATAIRTIPNQTVANILGQGKTSEAWAKRFDGRQIPVSDVAGPNGLLATLNAYAKRLEQASPVGKAALTKVSEDQAAIDKAVDAVREQFYTEMERQGEPTLREDHLDYGAMAELRDALRKNIPRAELAEAEKPTYRGVPFRGFVRHPLLAPSMVMGEILRPEAWPMFAAPPAVELVRTIAARGSTPNALLQKSMKAFGRE